LSPFLQKPNDMTKPQVEVLVFDLGKVLVDFSIDKACRQIAAVAGTSDNEVHKFLFKDGLEYKFEAGEISFHDLCAAFEKQFKISLESPRLKSAASDIFTPIDSTFEILRQLRHKHFKKIPFVLLSNTNEIHWEHIDRRWKVSELFDHLVLSHEVKALKPHEKIYREVLNVTGRRPSSCFFVDDIPENIAGAQRLGFDAVLFEGEKKLRQDLNSRGILP